MRDIHLSIPDIVNTLDGNTLSDLSISTEEPEPEVGRNASSYKKQQGGFFFGSSSSDNNSKVIQAAREKNYAVVSFMVENDMVTDFGKTDADKKTVLHYLVHDYYLNDSIGNTIRKILSSSKSSNFINKQDKQGNTPLHVAVKSGQHNLATALIKAGAKKTLKNDEGHYVASEDCPSVADSDTMGSTMSPVVMMNVTETDTPKLHASIKNMVDMFFKEPTSSKGAKGSADTDTEATLDVASMKQKIDNAAKKEDEDDTEAIQVIHQGSDKQVEASPQVQEEKKQLTGGINLGLNSINSANSDSEVNTDVFVERMMNKYSLHGGSSFQKTDTESRFESIVSEFTGRNSDRDGCGYQEGGVRGKRQLKSVPTIRNRTSIFGGASSDTSEANEDTPRGQLARFVDKQADEIHERVVKAIMDLMKVDEDTAKVYKAFLYRKVRDEKQDVRSPLDRAVAMEEMLQSLGKKELAKVDVEKYREMIKKAREERKERGPREPREPREQREQREQREPREQTDKPKRGRKTKTSSDEISETSSAEVPDETQLSRTSFSDMTMEEDGEETHDDKFTLDSYSQTSEF